MRSIFLVAGLPTLVGMLTLPATVAAQSAPPAQRATTPEWLDRLTVRGRAYTRYSYELGDGRRNFNEFDLDRIYLEFHWRLWDKGRIRHTLEGGDLRESGGSNDYFDVTTKHFYVEVQDPLYASTFLRLGLVDLPWVPYEEGLWGYRFQGTVFPDRSGYLTSTDLGVAAGGDIPHGYGSWQVSLVNGEGWKRNEVGRHKDAHARLTVNPLAGMGGAAANLFVAGFASVGAYDGTLYDTSGVNERRRYILQAGYRRPQRLALVGEYFRATDPAAAMQGRYPSLASRAGQYAKAVGVSVFGVGNLALLRGGLSAARWEVIGRFDHLDPDDAIADNELDRWIAGVSYRFNGALQGLLAYERVDYARAAQGANERRVMLQAEVRF